MYAGVLGEVYHATTFGEPAAAPPADARVFRDAGLDEGILSFCLPHSPLCGESL